MSYLQAVAGLGNLATDLPPLPDHGYACPVCGEHRSEPFDLHAPTWNPHIRGFCKGSDRVVPVAQVRAEREKIRAEWQKATERIARAEGGIEPASSGAYGLWQTLPSSRPRPKGKP